MWNETQFFVDELLLVLARIIVIGLGALFLDEALGLVVLLSAAVMLLGSERRPPA